MKKAIVIGATSGIGRELSIVLSQNGFRVGILGRRETLLNELVATNPTMFVAECCDISKIELVETSLKRLTSKLDGVDLVVISSGTGDINPQLDYSIEQQTIDLNVSAFTFVSDYFYNYFRKQNSGHIVAISSIMGIRGSAAAPAYAATKAYQINYLESLQQRAYTEKSNIKITDIRPGSVQTDMMKGEGHFWISSPEKASNQIFKAIKSNKSVCYISKRWAIIGLILKILPRMLYKKLGKI